MTKDVQWQQTWTDCFNFVWENEGRFPNKRSSDAEETRLGKWVARQRENYRKGKLTAERITALEEIEGWVWSLKPTSKPVEPVIVTYSPLLTYQ